MIRVEFCLLRFTSRSETLNLKLALPIQEKKLIN